MLLLLLLLFVSSFDAEAAARGPCQATLPRGPEVPAPIVLRTSCGGFRLGRDGTVSALPPGWFDARAGGTGRRYGADLRIRRTRSGRFALLRHGRIVWRSRGFYRNDGGSIAFGPGAFAFAAHGRGVYVTDLRSPERLITRGVGLYPRAFLRDGTLLVVKAGWGPSLSRVTQGGELLAHYRYRPKNGYVFDERAETLHFVTPGRVLVHVTSTSYRVVRPLGVLDGWLGLVGRHLSLSHFAHRGESDEIRFAVLEQDGSLVSRWAWRSPRRSGLDYGPVPSPDGRSFAFRTVTRPRGNVVVYILRAGEERPAAVFRHRGSQLGCGVGASFTWKGRHALYASTDGPAAVFDARSDRIRRLGDLMAALPSTRGERASVFWASDFGPADRRRA